MDLKERQLKLLNNFNKEFLQLKEFKDYQKWVQGTNEIQELKDYYEYENLLYICEEKGIHIPAFMLLTELAIVTQEILDNE